MKNYYYKAKEVSCHFLKNLNEVIVSYNTESMLDFYLKLRHLLLDVCLAFISDTQYFALHI